MNLWYYQSQGQIQGPVPLETLQQLCRQGVVRTTTPVRCGSQDWLYAGSVPELQSQFSAPAPSGESHSESRPRWALILPLVAAVCLLAMVLCLLWQFRSGGGGGGSGGTMAGRGSGSGLGPGNAQGAQGTGPHAQGAPRPSSGKSRSDSPSAASPNPAAGSSGGAGAATSKKQGSGASASQPDRSADVGQQQQADPGEQLDQPDPLSVGASFFGLEASGNTIVYVIDCSGSMAGARNRKARLELLKSIHALEEDQKFYVFFYSDRAFPMFFPDPPTQAPLPATVANVRRVTQWVEQFSQSGGTEPWTAMEPALKLRPDVIFLLTDGEFHDSVVGLIHQANQGTKIFTVCLGSRAGERILKQIAQQNGGKYRFVSVP